MKSISFYLNYLKYFFRYLLRPRALLSRKYFLGHETYAQAGQDIFAIMMNGFKKNGFFVEIGSQDPIKNNNSFLLEDRYGWKGFLLEIRDDFGLYCQLRRSNPCYILDATIADYRSLFEINNLHKQIEYLQIDIDPASASLLALKAIPHDEYRFNVITFEHDNYQGESSVMRESRDFLEGLGYRLIARNVKYKGADFEDWWVDSRYFLDLFDRFELVDMEWEEVVEKIYQRLNSNLS
jgi:hypothetical protein